MHPSSLAEIVQRRAAAAPDWLAYLWLVDGEREGPRLSWGDLDRRARVVARHLVGQGLRGERVLLLFPEDGLEFLVGLFGCFYGGVVAVPAPTPRFASRVHRLDALVRDAAPAGVLTVSRLQERLSEDLGLPCHATDALPDRAIGEPALPLPRSEDLAYLQYTSGSTSDPRGVMISHGNLLANVRMLHESILVPPGGCFVSWLPLFHDMGLVVDAMHAALVGGPCLLMAPMAFLARPLRWLKALSAHRGWFSGAPNFAYELCVARTTEEERRGLDLSCWRLAYSSSEPVRAATLQRFAEAFAVSGFDPEAFWPSYGLAEATAMVTTGPASFLDLDPEALGRDAVAPGDRTVVGCGLPTRECQVRIVDPETRTACAPDRVGEIWVRGAQVALGYWNRPGEAATFQAHLADTGEGPFLRTGDLGILREGRLYVTGRRKDILILQGRNLYPQDLEATAEACHPAFRPGFGAAFPVDVGGQERVAFAWEAADRSLEREEALSALRAAVAGEHGVDVHIVVLARKGSIPRTSSGKIRRGACRAMFLEGRLPEVARWTADREAQGGLAGGWGQDRSVARSTSGTRGREGQA